MEGQIYQAALARLKLNFGKACDIHPGHTLSRLMNMNMRTFPHTFLHPCTDA